MYIKESPDIIKEPAISIFGMSGMSVVDGPGKRVVLFFQGCNSRCAWCHSPHSQQSSSPLFFRVNNCLMCMKCAKVCKRDVHTFSNGRHLLNRELCIKCGHCIEACPCSSKNKESGVLYLPTQQFEAKYLLEQLTPCMKLCDGITLSGGEPLLQTEAAIAFLKLCKEYGYHTAVETSGLLNRESYISAVPYVDVWLFGVRIVTDSSDDFKTEQIKLVLKCIRERSGSAVIPRIPMVPGVTDRGDVLTQIHCILEAVCINEIWLNPWNRYYEVNYEASGMKPNFDIPSDEAVDECEREIIKFFSLKSYKIHT